MTNELPESADAELIANRDFLLDLADRLLAKAGDFEKLPSALVNADAEFANPDGTDDLKERTASAIFNAVDTGKTTIADLENFILPMN